MKKKKKKTGKNFMTPDFDKCRKQRDSAPVEFDAAHRSSRVGIYLP